MKKAPIASQPHFWEHQAVAIMRRHRQGREIITLTKVNNVSPGLIETTNHHWFFASNCASLDGDGSYIEPATFDHLAAVRWNRSI